MSFESAPRELRNFSQMAVPGINGKPCGQGALLERSDEFVQLLPSLRTAAATITEGC